MKNYLLLILAVLFISGGVYAQKGTGQTAEDAQSDLLSKASTDTSYWDWGNTFGAQFGQSAVINWAQGGQGQISTTFTGRSFANYIKNKHLWENQFIGDWGLVKFKGSSPQINANNLELNSVYGYKLSKTLYAGVLANLKSQFTWGFQYPDDGSPKVFDFQIWSSSLFKACSWYHIQTE